MNSRLSRALDRVTVGGVYQHYLWPDKRYRVIGVALHEMTLEPVVVYRAEGEPVAWVRPVDEFCALIDHRKRFQLLSWDTPPNDSFVINPRE